MRQKGFTVLVLIFGVTISSIVIVTGAFLAKQLFQQPTKQEARQDLQELNSPSPTQPSPTSSPSDVTSPTSNLDSCVKNSTVTTNSKPNNQAGITLQEDKKIIPLHPQEVITEIIGGKILIKWSGTGGDGPEYLICRRSVDLDSWQVIGEVKTTGDNRGIYDFEDTSFKPNTPYIYGVRFIGKYGNYSQITESSSAISP